MNSKNKTKVFSVVFAVLSIIFYVLVFISPFVVKAVYEKRGYNDRNIPIGVIVNMICSLLLGSVVVIRKEWIVIVISIITCAAGTVCTRIFGYFARFESIRWLTSGYLLLLLLVLLTILAKKMRKQKPCLILQKVIAALLFVNIAANIYMAANQFYWFLFGPVWENVYLEVVMVLNSLACAFWAVWYITHGKHSEE